MLLRHGLGCPPAPRPVDPMERKHLPQGPHPLAECSTERICCKSTQELSACQARAPELQFAQMHCEGEERMLQSNSELSLLAAAVQSRIASPHREKRACGSRPHSPLRARKNYEKCAQKARCRASSFETDCIPAAEGCQPVSPGTTTNMNRRGQLGCWSSDMSETRQHGRQSGLDEDDPIVWSCTHSCRPGGASTESCRPVSK